ncbi:abc transporter permease protein [hydrocarbon metagenome]|uniref:Abc transporter permease protein n=1 Tax=hydrocarbon metagenome TaxID=938273 RepID=A0A0W8F4H2_9ZZZZ
MNILHLAVRNIRRRKGRTFLTILGVAMAIAVLFSLLSFSSGYERELSREMGSLGVHLLAVPKGCPYEAASLIIHGGVIPKYLSASDLAFAQEVEGVTIASPMLLQHLFVNATPHIVYGVHAADMLRIKPWWRVEGRLFGDDEMQVMVVGQGLAEKEDLVVGSVIPAFGPMKEPFTVIGILDRTGGQDDEFHFIPLAEAQRIFDKDGKISTIAIQVSDPSRIGVISTRLEEIPDIQVVTMAQVQGTIMNLVGSARVLLYSLITVAVIISAFGITNTLLMSVNERVREFGMMKAIGASASDIGILVLAETMIITAIGGIAGTLGSLAAIGIIEEFVRGAIPYAPAGCIITPDPVLIAGCIAFSLLLGLVCGLYPALRSAKMTPMEAIRSEFE